MKIHLVTDTGYLRFVLETNNSNNNKIILTKQEYSKDPRILNNLFIKC